MSLPPTLEGLPGDVLGVQRRVTRGVYPNRRVSKNHERTGATSEALICAVMAHSTTRRPRVFKPYDGIVRIYPRHLWRTS